MRRFPSAIELFASLLVLCALCPTIVSAEADTFYVSDFGFPTGAIKKLSPGGVTTFVSGLEEAEGLAFDTSGNLYVALQQIPQIDKIAPNGTVSVFATGLTGFMAGLAFDGSGTFICGRSEWTSRQIYAWWIREPVCGRVARLARRSAGNYHGFKWQHFHRRSRCQRST
jgi:hypothetical protein